MADGAGQQHTAPIAPLPSWIQPSCWSLGIKRDFSLPRPISAGTMLLLLLVGQSQSCV